MNITLAQAQAAGIDSVLQVGANTFEFLRILNEAQQILCMGPEKWWNLVYWYEINITNGLITWPREIATIEGISACGSPLSIRSQWFQFVSNGYGWSNWEGWGGSQCCGQFGTGFYRWSCNRQMYDRGDSPLFAEIPNTGNPQNIWIYSTANENSSNYFQIYGFDNNGNRLFTDPGTGSFDGLSVTLPPVAGQHSVFTGYVGRIIAINKPITNGVITMFAVDSVTGNQVQIGQYNWDETNPQYRRSFISGVCPLTLPAGATIPIRVLAKREFVPATNPSDILMIGSMPALKRMMVAVKGRDRAKYQEAAVDEAKAFEILEREAAHYLGSAQTAPLQIFSETWGTGGIPCLR